MKQVLSIIALLAAMLGVWASEPAYFNEERVALTAQQVCNDSRYSRMAVWFGLPADVFKTHSGCVVNAPVGADGKFRWGQCMEKPYPWPAITPQESREMPGVLYDLKNGFFLHAQKGIDGNAILLYGKFCLRQPRDGKDGCDGRDGRDGKDGKDGECGPPGPPGPRGPKGEKGDTVYVDRGPATIINNYTFSSNPYPSAQMMGVYGATIYQWQLAGVGYSTGSTRININNQNWNCNTNNNSNSNSNSNANTNVVNSGDGSASGSSEAGSGSTAASGGH